MTARSLVILLVSCVGALVAGAIGFWTAFAEASSTPARKVDLRTLIPGQQRSVALGDLMMEISIPKGEGHTWGSFHVKVRNVGFDSGSVKRNGSMESAWIADMNGDEVPDAVLVVRGGGSGSRASIVVLESRSGSYAVVPLPPASAVPGYMGHDEVFVRDGKVLRSFPTYVHKSRLRTDRQWNIDRGLSGQVPVKRQPDTNSSPSGETVVVGFDRSSGGWRGVR